MRKHAPFSRLADQFPIVFANGYQIDTLAFWCKKCGKVADVNSVFGATSQIVPSTIDLSAHLLCDCGSISNYTIRLRDDRTVSYLDETGWNDVSPVKSKGSLLSRRWILTKTKLKLMWQYFCLWVEFKRINKELINRLGESPETHRIQTAYSRMLSDILAIIKLQNH